MTRTIVITDLHGDALMLHKVLLTTKLDPNKDRLVVLGDYVDRGKESRYIIDMLINLKRVMEDRLVTLIGNHDDWLLSFLDGSMHEGDIPHWYRYGGSQCVSSYLGDANIHSTDYRAVREFIMENFESHYTFLRELKMFHEDDKFFFTHSGAPPHVMSLEGLELNEYIWANRMLTFQVGNSLPKPLVVGHTPVPNIHKKRGAFYSFEKNIIGIDGGAIFGEMSIAMVYSDDSDEILFYTHDIVTGKDTIESISYSSFTKEENN